MPCAPAKRDSQQANVTIKVNDKTATATLVRTRDAKSAKPQPAHRISIPHHVTCSQFIHSTRLDARGLCRRVSCATVRPHFRTAENFGCPYSTTSTGPRRAGGGGVS